MNFIDALKADQLDECRRTLSEDVARAVDTCATQTRSIKLAAREYQVQSDRTAELLAGSIRLLESIHMRHACDVPSFDTKTGNVAWYIVQVRVITLLSSILRLLQAENTSESTALLRPLNEAVQLGYYFCFAHYYDEEKEEIARWFEEDFSPRSKDVGSYVEQSMGKWMRSLCANTGDMSGLSDMQREAMAWATGSGSREQGLRRLSKNINWLRSKFIHHTHRSIMEYSCKGFLAETKNKDWCFEYQKTTMPALLSMAHKDFERCVIAAIHGFMTGSHLLLDLSVDELVQLDSTAQIHLSRTVDAETFQDILGPIASTSSPE
jgi:hypothetical protein